MQNILKYFPHLTEIQKKQYEALFDLYAEWNTRINVISRKDINNLYEHHVQHSLAISKYVNFRPETTILDFGTGGGFPGIPLAIMFPNVSFKLIDGTRKKIHVADEIIRSIGLENCRTEHIRGEEEKGLYDFVVSRAVMQMPDLIRIVRKNISKTSRNDISNGVICLKGGNIDNEISPYRKIADVTDISTIFSEEWFKGKHIVHVPM